MDKTSAGGDLPSLPAVTIRRATDDDGRALRRLAQLDSAPVPDGPLLVAEIDGEPVAALSMTSGECIADPFVRTLELRRLLELRALQLDLEEPRRARRGWRRPAYSGWRTTGRRLALASSSRRTGVV